MPPAHAQPTARTTLRDSTSLVGVGLFSASPSTITIAPNTRSTGIVFRHDQTDIPLHINHLSLVPVHRVFAHMKPRCTSIGDSTINIATIEHICSALTGLGITDAIITIESDNPHCEIPIMDGSALDFVRAIQSVGIVTLETTVKPITITRTIRVVEGDSSITIEPNDSPFYSYALDYNAHAHIPNATVTWDGNREDYINRIAPARTFSLQHEADAMHSAGLFTHLSTSDMLVIGPTGPIDNAFRHPHECALHKLLDLIGDMALVSRPLIAKVVAIKSGHALAHQAARAVLDHIELKNK